VLLLLLLLLLLGFAAELLGNYVLPAPQRVSDMAFAYCKSQVSLCSLVAYMTTAAAAVAAAVRAQHVSS
jgi:hypothetical protein